MASPVAPDTITDRLSDDNVDMVSDEVVVEEIEEECDELDLERRVSKPISPPPPPYEAPEQEATSPARVSVTRNFGNISPISDLSDNDDLLEGNGDVDLAVVDEFESADNGAGKVTPEPGTYPVGRTSFPRISDGRSSPILAYSPSLLKSPPSNGSSKTRNSNSPSANGDRVQKRPRNITRMLDNISDHSSGEEEVNNVGVMMAKFTV